MLLIILLARIFYVTESGSTLVGLALIKATTQTLFKNTVILYKYVNYGGTYG